jgi:hypothetical protein
MPVRPPIKVGVSCSELPWPARPRRPLSPCPNEYTAPSGYTETQRLQDDAAEQNGAALHVTPCPPFHSPLYQVARVWTTSDRRATKRTNGNVLYLHGPTKCAAGCGVSISRSVVRASKVKFSGVDRWEVFRAQRFACPTESAKCLSSCGPQSGSGWREAHATARPSASEALDVPQYAQDRAMR